MRRGPRASGSLLVLGHMHAPDAGPVRRFEIMLAVADQKTVRAIHRPMPQEIENHPRLGFAPIGGAAIGFRSPLRGDKGSSGCRRYARRPAPAPVA